MTSNSKRTPRRRYRKDPFNPGQEAMPNAMQIWHVLGPLDETARRMEQKWGIERLPTLAPEAMAGKFGMARDHLDQLLAGNDEGADNLDAITQAAENLRRGWLAMDEAATAANAATFDPIGWSLTIGGQKSVIVRDPAAAAQIQRISDGVTVYTLDEVANIMAASIASIAPALAEIKQGFPGSKVSVAPKGGLPDDEIPF